MTDQQVESQNNQHTVSTLCQAAQAELKWQWTERTEPKWKQAWCMHQEPTTKAFQQVTNSYYEWMTPKAIQAPSRKQDHGFHLKKWARKASRRKQQWHVSCQTQALPYGKDKIGSDTLVLHASLRIKPSSTNKAYIAKAILQRQIGMDQIQYMKTLNTDPCTNSMVST